MAILITGGAGFVGFNIAETLLERGIEVVLFDSGSLPPGSAQVLEPYDTQLSIEHGSVLDLERLDAAFRMHRIERVIHAAAVTSGADREARDPANIVEVNVRGTINVLQTARKHGVVRTIYVGSGASYGESLYRLPRLYEDSPSIPTTLYSITKHAAERMCMRLRDLWKSDVVCVRLGTMIGPWERDTGVRDNFGTHSQLVALALAGKVAVLTSREVKRDWVYSRDAANAIAALAYAPTLKFTLYNVSSGLNWERPIRAWCEALSSGFPRFSYRTAQSDDEANIWYTDRDRGLMDVGRLARDVGFTPQFQMHEAYAAYIDWIQRMLNFTSNGKCVGD